MPRAHRYYMAGHIWHLTHRCHRRQFLLRYKRDRWAWVGWLYEARRRHGLCVLDYMVTSNHVHLIVRDRGEGEIAASMQLLEGCLGQAYNRRKDRRGAYWEDNYHATAVEGGLHLVRCLVYVDLNMVRAGVVAHPREWQTAGYHEIQVPRRRYRIIDRVALAAALQVEMEQLSAYHAEWIETALAKRDGRRQAQWTESVAVGSRVFSERVIAELGARARDRRVEHQAGLYVVREATAPYWPRIGAEKVPISTSQPLPDDKSIAQSNTCYGETP
jgi:putative transposase